MAPRGRRPIYGTEEERAAAKKAQNAERQRQFKIRQQRVKQENDLGTDASLEEARGQTTTPTSYTTLPVRYPRMARSRRLMSQARMSLPVP
jgi:hypothetical protein